MHYYDQRTAPKLSKMAIEFQEWHGVKLPTNIVVCRTCGGKGSHVNPSIDAGGLTRQDFAEDPDFYEDYMSGVYDVACYECKGRNVIDEVDEELLKARDPDLYKQWIDWVQSEHDAQAEYEAERRMGC